MNMDIIKTTTNRFRLVRKACCMFDKGYTCSEIAAKLGISESTVRAWKEDIDRGRNQQNT